MNVLSSIALWLALIMLSCCGHVGGHEKEELTTGYPAVTVTSDYEYDYSFDYSDFPETERYVPNKVSGIGQLSLILLLGLAVLQLWN